MLLLECLKLYNFYNWIYNYYLASYYSVQITLPYRIPKFETRNKNQFVDRETDMTFHYVIDAFTQLGKLLQYTNFVRSMFLSAYF